MRNNKINKKKQKKRNNLRVLEQLYTCFLFEINPLHTSLILLGSRLLLTFIHPPSLTRVIYLYSSASPLWLMDVIDTIPAPSPITLITIISFEETEE